MEGVDIMASWGKTEFAQLKQYQKRLQEIQEKELQTFLESCTKELAQRLLREVKLRTPVGEYTGKSYLCKVRKGEQPRHKGSYSSGKTGGTLRNAWTTGQLNPTSDGYEIIVINPVRYAPYVEFGHRTPTHKGWVKGHFMMTISEKEIRKAAPGILERKLQKWLNEVFQ